MIQLETTPLSRCVTLLSRCHAPGLLPGLAFCQGLLASLAVGFEPATCSSEVGCTNHWTKWSSVMSGHEQVATFGCLTPPPGVLLVRTQI